MHYFLAISPDEEGKNAISRIANCFRRSLPYQKWVHRDDYHITLVFLGNVSEEQLAAVRGGVTAIAGRHQPFTVEVKGIGTFGSRSRPRVLWSAVSKNQFLFQLQKETADLCRQVGVPVDIRPYRPHVTLAKKWRGLDPINRDEIHSCLALSESKITWVVRQIILFRTNLEDIPHYEAAGIFPLDSEVGPM